MMRYYRWSCNERYRCFDNVPKKMRPLEDKEIRYGKPISHLWQPFSFKFEEERWYNGQYYPNKKKFSDFPFLDITFVAISGCALKCLRELIEPYVEIFPLHIVNSDRVYYGLNVLKVFDIDYRRSDTLDEDHILVHAFPGDKLPDAAIFRIKPTMLTNVYISEEFRQIVEANRLSGLLFDEEMKYRTGCYFGKHKYYDNLQKEICYGDDPLERPGINPWWTHEPPD